MKYIFYFKNSDPRLPKNYVIFDDICKKTYQVYACDESLGNYFLIRIPNYKNYDTLLQRITMIDKVPTKVQDLLNSLKVSDNRQKMFVNATKFRYKHTDYKIT